MNHDASREDGSVNELRSSVRFPLRLPVEIRAEQRPLTGETRNISANGVLFAADRRLDVGTAIEFAIAMPAAVLGTPTDVVVQCLGRVVRCTGDGARTAIAAVIDEYRLGRQQ